MPIDVTPAEPVAAICAVTAAGDEALAAAVQRLTTSLGTLRHQSRVFAFDFTAYYEAEMGAGLVKQLLCLAAPADPAVLAEMKRATMAMEREMAWGSGHTLRRRANLDPGLVSIDSLVLASTKSSGHRICIGPSLYAEVTLLFEKGAYRALPWTYRDYLAPEAQRFLLETRQWLRDRRRATAGG